MAPAKYFYKISIAVAKIYCIVQSMCYNNDLHTTKYRWEFTINAPNNKTLNINHIFNNNVFYIVLRVQLRVWVVDMNAHSWT